MKVKSKLQKFPKLKNPIFIEGLPGIGHVGKLAVDFMIDELKAKKFLEVYSHSFPNLVFVNEKNLVELPTVKFYYAERKGKNDIIIMSGDVQPTEEKDSYEFTEQILKLLEEMNVSQIITLGGIGLQNPPKEPKVYCTGNSKELIDSFKKSGTQEKIYGIVGPIIGITGLLLGLADLRKIKAVSLLAESFGNPSYLGIDGAKEIVKILNKKLSLGIDIKKMEIKPRKEKSKKEEEIHELTNELTKKIKKKIGEDMSYIG